MLKQFVDSAAFQNGVLAIVVLAGVLVGLETEPQVVARYGRVIHLLDQIIIGLFVLEAILKMAAHGRHFYRYFFNAWNIFDFIIVVVCLLPFDAQYAAVLRLVRIIRALKLISALPRLQLLVGSLLRSLPSMGYIGLLLLILFYVYAVTGIFLWRDNDPGHFGDLPTAMLTLFRVVTLEDWTDVMYTQMWGAEEYPSNAGDFTPANPRPAPVLGAVYFVSFVLLGTMIILNLFIGVILNSMTEAQKDAEAAAQPETAEEDDDARLVSDVAALGRKLDEANALLETMGTRLRDRLR